MERLPLSTWTAAKLKRYLKARGIPHSGYSKAVLVSMVEKAVNNPGLTEFIEDNDSDIAAASRRTVDVNGSPRLFPDPLAITSWDTDLTSLPSLTSAKCLVYLLSKKGWSSDRVISFEKDRGYQLFLENHIQDVKLREEDHNMTYVRALCTRQTAQSEKPYHVWLLLSSTGTIETAGCQCTG